MSRRFIIVFFISLFSIFVISHVDAVPKKAQKTSSICLYLLLKAPRAMDIHRHFDYPDAPPKKWEPVSPAPKPEGSSPGLIFYGRGPGGFRLYP